MSWSSKKQQIVTLSSTEAEYVSLTHTAKEALWVWSFVSKILGKPTGTIPINCNNQGAIALSKDNKFHGRTKHIDLRYHFIWECIEDGKVTMDYIPSNENMSDIFT